MATQSNRHKYGLGLAFINTKGWKKTWVCYIKIFLRFLIKKENIIVNSILLFIMEHG